MLKQILISVCSIVIAISVVVLIRTFTFNVRTDVIIPCQKTKEHSKIDIGTNPQIVENFRQALRFKTISWSHGVYETEELIKFRLFIEQSMSNIFFIYPSFLPYAMNNILCSVYLMTLIRIS